MSFTTPVPNRTTPSKRTRATTPDPHASTPLAPLAPVALPGLTSGPMPSALTKNGGRATDTTTPVLGNLTPLTPVPTARTRPALSPKAILEVVHSSAYLKSQLKASTHAQQREQRPETMAQRVTAVLVEVDAMFGTEPVAEAMALAVALDKVAAVVASELYDPSLRPKIAADLFAVYGPKLEAALTKKKVADPQGTVALAKVLASSDPVALYMHGEKRLDDAAREVYAAADTTGRDPLEMLRLMRGRFEAEMASYSRTKIGAQEDRASTYNLSESTGELSTAYFKRLFGDTEKATKDAGTKRLEFSPEATRMLDALDAEVAKGRPAAAPADAAGRRQQLFDDVQAADDSIRDMRERHVLATLQNGTWSLNATQAQKVIDKLKSPTGLEAIPLTITHWADRRSQGRDGAPLDSQDRSRAGQTTDVTMAEKIGKNHTKAQAELKDSTRASVGRFDDPYAADRGERYMQFRSWKDATMSGNLGMSGEELPVFGAVNLTFEAFGGTDDVPMENIEKTIADLGAKKRRTPKEQQVLDSFTAEKRRLDALTEDDTYGMNYYGDMHLKLKTAAVRNRTLYTASDHGQPHRDPFLAFADMLVGTKTDAGTGETYYSDRTGLKRGGNGVGVMNSNQAAQVIATVLGTAAVAKMNLPFEIQIFGGVDWETDVEEIWVSPAAPQAAFDRLDAWSRAAPGRPPVARMVRPPGVNVVDKNAVRTAAKLDAANLP